MGNGIAHVFAQSGFQVYLFDAFEAAIGKAIFTIDKNLARLLKKGKITEDEIKATLANIKPTYKLEDAADADFAIEAATENKQIKFDLFKKLDEMLASDAILAPFRSLHGSVVVPAPRSPKWRPRARRARCPASGIQGRMRRRVR